MDDERVNRMGDIFGQVLIWVIVGILVLWLISHLAEIVGKKLMPSLPFIIIALVVGIAGVAAINKLFG